LGTDPRVRRTGILACLFRQTGMSGLLKSSNVFSNRSSQFDLLNATSNYKQEIFFEERAI
jgi:hypothetical protein